MTKSISCTDAGKDCSWSALAETENELIGKVEDHVKEFHKDIEWTSDTVESIKLLIKET